jgi:uncharacterized transporter YbjL
MYYTFLLLIAILALLLILLQIKIVCSSWKGQMCRGISAVQSYHMITAQNHLLRSKSSNYFACTQSFPDKTAWTYNLVKKTFTNPKQNTTICLFIYTCLVSISTTPAFISQTNHRRKKKTKKAKDVNRWTWVFKHWGTCIF